MSRVLLVLLGLVLVAGAVVYGMYRADLSAARARTVARSQILETKEGTVEYATLGSGPPILTIHGTGGGFDQGLDMTGALAADGYQLVAPSRFGYLRSTFPDNATVAMQADAFAELLDKLGIDRAIVFGGSAGALSAMQFAIRYPDRCRALVLAVPAAYAPTRKPNTSGAEGPLLEGAVRALLGSDFLFWAALKLLPDGMTTMLLATDPALVHAASTSEQARVQAILHNILPVSVRSEGLLFDMKTAGAPEPYPIERITCPVLTVSMRDDKFGTYDPAEYIAANVANGRAVLYPTGGHVWVGHDADMWTAVSGFLGEIAVRDGVARPTGGGPVAAN